jgi:hypothetical protein
MTQPFRILSLDGGGIMGAFAASALATFEHATGRRIVEHFDLITGTSTGGIMRREEREERGHALQPVPISRVHMRLVALCVAGAAVYDAAGCALTVR